MRADQLQAQLAHFTGSASLTRHGLVGSVLMTEGVVFLAQTAGAHWLADAIASYVHDPRTSAQPFQAWRLVVDPATHRATLTMTDGNSEAAIVTQDIDYTDFPMSEITLWLIQGGDLWTLLLPSEY